MTTKGSGFLQFQSSPHPVYFVYISFWVCREDGQNYAKTTVELETTLYFVVQLTLYSSSTLKQPPTCTVCTKQFPIMKQLYIVLKQNTILLIRILLYTLFSKPYYGDVWQFFKNGYFTGVDCVQIYLNCNEGQGSKV